MADANLSAPVFETDDFFIVTLMRESYVGKDVGKNRFEKLSLIERRIVELLLLDSSMTAANLSVELNKSQRTIERYLKDLREKGVIERQGSKTSGIWVVLIE